MPVESPQREKRPLARSSVRFLVEAASGQGRAGARVADAWPPVHPAVPPETTDSGRTFSLPRKRRQPFTFNVASFAAMNARMASDISRSFSHCSLYKVIGKRPIP